MRAGVSGVVRAQGRLGGLVALSKLSSASSSPPDERASESAAATVAETAVDGRWARTGVVFGDGGGVGCETSSLGAYRRELHSMRDELGSQIDRAIGRVGEDGETGGPKPGFTDARMGGV